jgi:hypothetical protein
MVKLYKSHTGSALGAEPVQELEHLEDILFIVKDILNK